jgi:putative endonuclease
MTWHVYMVRTVDDFLYTGIAVDVGRRYQEHLTRGPKAAKYLLAHAPRELAFEAEVGSRSLALKVERHLKRLTRAGKDSIVRAGSLRFDPDTGRILQPRRSP